MHRLGYAGPSTGSKTLADNFVFRLIFATAGTVWNALLILIHASWCTGADVERTIAGAVPPIGADAPARLRWVLDLQLHRLAPAVVILLLVLLAGVAIWLMVHALRQVHTTTRLIPWPRRYWIYKASLTALLLVAMWLQYELYARIDDDLFRWTDNFKNPGPDSRYANLLLATFGSIFGLLPVVSSLDHRSARR